MAVGHARRRYVPIALIQARAVWPLLLMHVLGPLTPSHAGHMRRAGLLEYATILRTGHLVPTVVPEVFAQLMHDFLRP